MKRTIEMTAWSSSLEGLKACYDASDNDPNWLNFANHDMSVCGWIRIGTATIHLDLIYPKDTVAAQVESLQAQITKTMADSEATITILRSRINDLLAIENSQVQP